MYKITNISSKDIKHNQQKLTKKYRKDKLFYKMNYKRTIIPVTIFLIMIFIFSGCTIPQQSQGIIEGRVLLPPDAMGLSRDVSGWVPAVGAEVTIVDANGATHTVTTDENGYYSFENLAVNANTVITAIVEVNGSTVILKKVIPNAVAEDENYDAGTMSPEDTAIALVVEKLLQEGIAQGDIDLDEIAGTDSFADLVGQITIAIEEGNDVIDDPDVIDGAGDAAEEILNPPTPPPSGPSTVAVTGVALDQKTLTLTAGGETATLTATVAPENATNKNVTWTSDDEDVATIADGVVTPLAAGTATITVTTEDGEFTVSCVITVEAATISLADPDEIISGDVGYTRFAIGVDVSDTVSQGDYDFYFIFEISQEFIIGNPEVRLPISWLESEQDDNKYKFELPGGGTDLYNFNDKNAEFQVKIAGDELTLKAYLVDTEDNSIVLSNVLEETIEVTPAPNPVHNITRDIYYETIQEAIEEAEEYNHIFVYPGIYEENIIITTNGITLEGYNKDTTTINGSVMIVGESDRKISTRNREILTSREKETPEISGVTISGFTIDGVNEGYKRYGLGGIVLEGATNCNIQSNKITGFNYEKEFGIVLYSSTQNNIQHNIIENNYSGILIEYFSENIINNNKITDNSNFGVINIDETDTIDARYNWWGSASGPGEGGANGVEGNVEYDPWYIDEDMTQLGSNRPVYNSTQKTFHDYIQEAIEKATDGDTILVGARTFEENIEMTTPVNLIGEGEPLIIGTLIIEDVSGIEIEGICFQIDTGFAIYMRGSNDGISIYNCTFQEGDYGAIIGSADNLRVENSTIENCLSGIYLVVGDNLQVIDTDISVVAEGPFDDTYDGTYCVRFANHLEDSTDISIINGNFFIDRNDDGGLEAGVYQEPIIIHSKAAGYLNITNLTINDKKIEDLSDYLLTDKRSIIIDEDGELKED